jgi:hypothetical protein
MIELTLSTKTYGRDARARLLETADLGREGARAALETFYRAFTDADLELLTEVWLDHPLVQMDTPIGGLRRGLNDVTALFTSPLDGWIEFGDVLEIWTPANAVFAGRERGDYVVAGETLPLTTRTTHCISYAASNGGWRLVHHHGSFDDPNLLARYQDATRMPAAEHPGKRTEPR